ncbi:RrF2 family transcriptional regulator [Rhizobium grahamii]|uniref:BadM/Rrf2 family transcriptional regulator n=1 Tax=Rhizobium grahamii CCGE 502 TaxID=990285 RepID=S3IAZ1_9HYPH|nr:Rrf2 family transcriptional regulator [Rhizobium grahamii]EPE96433.1 BadM/Rrf2 family transcriptional regulator [Rhizobium grahamii CCGE 502]
MRLTTYTDYAIRVLVYLGAPEGELCSIREIATAFAISQSHVMKVVQDLSAPGFYHCDSWQRRWHPNDQIG